MGEQQIFIYLFFKIFVVFMNLKHWYLCTDKDLISIITEMKFSKFAMTPEMLLLCIPVYNQEESQAVLP